MVSVAKILNIFGSDIPQKQSKAIIYSVMGIKLHYKICEKAFNIIQTRPRYLSFGETVGNIAYNFNRAWFIIVPIRLTSPVRTNGKNCFVFTELDSFGEKEFICMTKNGTVDLIFETYKECCDYCDSCNNLKGMDINIRMSLDHAKQCINLLQVIGKCTGRVLCQEAEKKL